jgi:hypothetical protein
MKLRDWIDSSKLNWCLLSGNKNAIELLKENPDKIVWSFLSENHNAIEILKDNPDKIVWMYFSENPKIFI